MKMKLNLRDIMKINSLFETSRDVDAPIVLSKKDGKNLYIMNEKTYRKINNKSSSDDSIRDKEIKCQSGKCKRK